MSYTYLLEGGGGILGGILLGHTCVCAVEIEPKPRQMLLQRQRDGILPPFPIWDDVCTFDGNPWRGHVDIICGGFPCTDISAANTGNETSGTGIDGERSGLWKEMQRIICEVRPGRVLVENSPMLTLRGLGVVLGDLAAMGYDAKWGVLGAEHSGGSHARHRMWIYADTVDMRLQRRNRQAAEVQREIEDASAQVMGKNPLWPDVSNPRTFGSNDGVASRVDRLKAIGNGQVPAVVKLAWDILTKGIPT